jgi:uncharacterized hydrophobic protein (TIGR00271 family)
MKKGSIGVLLGPDLDVELQLRWAIRLAEARQMDLLIYQQVDRQDGEVVERNLTDEADGDGAAGVREISGVIEAYPHLRAGRRETEASDDDTKTIHLRCKQIPLKSLTSFRQLLLADVQKEKLPLMTAARSEMNTTDPDYIKERRLFLRFAPCEVVFCFGLHAESRFEKIMVGISSGSHGSSAMRLGRDLTTESKTPLTAARVNPSIGPDSEGVGQRRLEALLKKSFGSGLSDLRRRVVVDDQTARGLRQLWETERFDLVVLGASRLGLLGSHIGAGVGAKLSRGETRPTLALVSSASPIRNRFLGLTEGFVERLVPQIDRENRVSLVDRIQSSSQWDFDFFALMFLSTFMAAIGLIQDSAAVVIGAMLVAPLMTPLVGLGLALVQGNPVLSRISLRSIGFGVLVSLVVGALVGLATPGFDEPTREMLGRGGPGLLDLFVAFAAGLAAAYASSRPGLLAALPGVAIAAALVPPIATSGLALSLGDFGLATNAFLLFLINMFTIVLASMTSLWAVGLRNIKKASRWRLLIVNAVMFSVLVLGAFLSIKPDVRSTDQALPAGLVPALQSALGEDYQLYSIGLAYDEIGTQLNLRIVGTELAPAGLAGHLRSTARSYFAIPVRVRLVTQLAPSHDQTQGGRARSGPTQANNPGASSTGNDSSN